MEFHLLGKRACVVQRNRVDMFSMEYVQIMTVFTEKYIALIQTTVPHLRIIHTILQQIQQLAALHQLWA